MRIIAVIALIIFLTLAGCSSVDQTGLTSDDFEFSLFKTDRADYTIDQVSSVDFSTRFTEHSQPIFNFGLTSDTHWIRFRLPDADTQDNDLTAPVLAFDYAIEDIEIYILLDDDSHTAYLHGGYGSFPQNDELAGLTPAFLIPSDCQENGYCYIRIQTSASAGFRIDWFDWDTYKRLMQSRIMFLTLLSGFLLAMAFYNFFLFFALRYKQYLFYVFYALTMLIYQSTIVGTVRIAYPPLASLAFEHAQLLGLTTMFFWLLFAYHFLNIAQNLPKFKPWYNALMLLAIIGVPVNFLIGVEAANYIAYILGLSMPLIAMISIFVSRKRGYRVSPYYLAGTIVLLLAVMIFALRGWGIIPHSVAFTYAIFVASSAEAMLYSFALATQIRNLSIQNYTLQQQQSKLSRISIIDHLTGLYNKRDFNATYEKELNHAREDNLPLSLILIDIDLFKGINDTYGHRSGDEVLRRLGIVLKEQVRELGHSCRVGGEEFAIILANTTIDQAEKLADRIRIAFSEEAFHFSPGGKLNCTISLGVGQLKAGESNDELYDRVDKALYKSKFEGRNRVSLSG